MSHDPILVINSGSSSLKFGLFTNRDGDEYPLVSGLADGIGRSAGKIELRDEHNVVLQGADLNLASEAQALEQAAEWLNERFPGPLAAVGHRVVHGGPRLVKHQAITPAVVQEMKSCEHFAPLHIPVAIELIEAIARRYPNVPQFACFDTVFHCGMPEIASRFALPSGLFDEGIRRYGFHGLSYESVVYQLGRSLPSRAVIAHLGNGASLAAIKDGRSIDTTMGLTPAGGIPMATRSGDLDPGVFLYLQRVKRLTPNSLEQLLNHQSGLAAVSNGSGDMRDLEAAAQGGDRRAQRAIDLFCTSIRKVIGAYAALLGGIEMLVFAGGIGEHSARTRANICHGLSFLGVLLDEVYNNGQQGRISAEGSRVPVHIVASQEDLQIARHCRALLCSTPAHSLVG